MVQRTFKVRLSKYASWKLADMTEGKSTSAEEVAAMLLEQALFDYDDFTWINGDPRDDHADNHDLNEQGRPWSEVRPELEAYLAEKLAQRG